MIPPVKDVCLFSVERYARKLNSFRHRWQT
jgi:hypothetical protein